ncbi:hypothetical protein ES705_19729 [subsurface metagenome]
MANLLDTLMDFIRTFFSSDLKEAERKKDLREINSSLRLFNPPYFKVSTAQLLPAFASYILILWRLSEQLADILGRTVHNQDSRLAERYRDFLLQAHLTENESRKIAAFSYDQVKARITRTASIKEELKNLDEEFKVFIARFSGEEFIHINEEIAQLERLHDLGTFDYSKIISLFDSKFDRKYPGKLISASPVTGEEAITELLDLFFILAGIDLTEGVERNFTNLLKRLERERAPKSIAATRQLLVRLDKLFKQSISPQIILNLIRAINKDPYLNPKSEKVIKPHLQSYMERLANRYKMAKERILREEKEKTVAHELKELFHDADLLELRGYNSHLAQTLVDNDFLSFSHIKPICILKSFLHAKFQNNLIEALKKLVVEGYFEDKLFETTFSSTFHGSEALIDMINQFEEDLNGSGHITVTNINKYLDNHNKGKPVSAALNKLVETINFRAGSLVGQGANLLFNLGNHLYRILLDAKQSSPVEVTNIKVIRGINNREFLKDLVDGYDDIKHFVNIISHFTVIHQAVKPHEE